MELPYESRDDEMMQCPSCGAPNKDEAKFCAECGKPLVPGSDDEQIERLVDYLVANWFDLDEGCSPPDAKAKGLLREAARGVHAKWKANPHVEDAVVKIDEPELDVDESFDGDELAEIFSGREAVERAEEERKYEEKAKENEAREKAKVEKERMKLEETKREKKREDAQSTKFVLVGMAVLLSATFGIAFLSEKHKDKEHKEEPSADKHESHRTAKTTPATATTTATPTPEPEPPPPVAIASCTCVSRANGKNTFVLEQPPAGGPWHVKWDQSAGFASMHSGFWLGDSDAGAAISVPRDTTQLHAAMACENEIVAIVAGDVASAWTGTDSGELLWTRKLPSPYAFPSDAGTGDVGCAPVLGVTGNVFTVQLAKGKTITLSIRDGAVTK